MKILPTTLATMAIAGLVAFVAPAASASAPLDAGQQLAPTGTTADGRLHAWEHPRAGGVHCSWPGNDDEWATCDGGNLANKASDIYNNGYANTYDDVNLYYNPSWGGAYACLGRGDSWNNLPQQDVRFTWWPGMSGHNKQINDNVRSHRWVQSCPTV